MVSKIMKKNAHQLDLPNTLCNHNFIQVTVLDLYAPPVEGQHPSEPTLMMVDDSKEWTDKIILDSKLQYRKVHFVVQWVGCSHIRTSWEPTETLDNGQMIVDEFHRMHSKKQRRK